MPELKGMSVGSPPRMRGKATDIYTIANALGITPAYAGKSFGRAVRLAPGGDHPRVCGEKCNAAR